MSKISESHAIDEHGNPAGGSSIGMGITVTWQSGPLGRGADRIEPNGAFVEDVLKVALGRLRFYQTAEEGKFACRHNALAITKIEEAVHWLNARTAEREEREVEGLNIP